MPNYPTKEQILEREHLFKPELLRAVKAWKMEHYNGSWSTMTLEQKLASLCALVDVLDGGQRTVRVTIGSLYCYQPGSRTIAIKGDNPSILSTIHEMGHHVKGRSELAACRYSVWLFKKCFPKAYERLEWRGHMLVRPIAPQTEMNIPF
jgi:hypothetical protein